MSNYNSHLQVLTNVIKPRFFSINCTVLVKKQGKLHVTKQIDWDHGLSLIEAYNKHDFEIDKKIEKFKIRI